MDFDIIDTGRRLVAGHVVRTSNTAEMDPEQARIPGLWGRAASAGDMVAVLTDYESGRDGEFTHVVGREIAEIGDARAGELVAQVPAGTYAVFATSGEAPGSIIDGWRRVWQAEDEGRLRRGFATDFELWPADGPPQIHVSVA